MTRDVRQTFGFCPMCMQNIEHTRKFSFPVLSILDFCSLRILRLFRIGPWYCYQCERKSIYLPLVKEHAPTFHRREARSDFINPDSIHDVHISDVNGSAEQLAAESVGNYIKNESSLVMHDKRSNRYSEKFRDATVRRVLSAINSIADIREELSITEADLIGWIANYVQRKKDRIKVLTDRIEAISERLPEPIKIELESSELMSDQLDDVVEGRVLPK